MPWYLYLALKQLFPTGRGLSFFTFMSALGVGLGVVMLVVSTSVMSGFGHDIRQMIVDTQGEIQIGANHLLNPEPILTKVLQQPGVAAAVPFARNNVLLQFEDKPAWGPAILGFDLERVQGVLPLDHYMIQGSLGDLDDDSLILSLQLARELGVRVGDRIDIYSPLLLQAQKDNEVVLPRTVRVAGIFQIGHQQLDRALAIGSLRLTQELYALGKDVHGVMVRLKPGVDEFKTAAALNAMLPRGVRARTWYELNVDFQNVIKLEKNLIFFLLAFITVIAALSIMSSLTIAVVRKTREIGLLGALGGKPGQVAACFCAQGFILGVIGTIGGLGMAWLILHFRQEIVDLLARATVSEEVFQQFYGFTQFPSYTDPRDLVKIIVGAIAAATLAGLVPAWRAAKLKPVEALRSE